MAYTTKTKVDALFGVTMTQAVFDDLLAAVKLFIDRYTGKTFEGASASRYYDGPGNEVINVDPFYGTAAVEILDSNGNTEVTLTEGAGDDYVTAPYNSTEKNQIILTPNGRWSKFPWRMRGVKVTATFGFSGTVPADIQLVATQMIGELYNSSLTATTGDIQSESLGDYAVTYANDGGTTTVANRIGAFQILDLYRDIEI